MGCARTDRLAKSWAGRDNRAGGESGRTAAGTAGQDPAPKGPGPRTRDGKPGASRRVPGSRPAAPPTSDRDPSCGPLLTDHFVGPHRAHRPANQRGDQQGARAPAHDPRSYSHRRPPGGCRSLRQRPHEWLDSSPEFHRLPEATHLWDIGRTESPATPDSRGALRRRRTAKGRVEGRIETLRRQLTKRFGPLPSELDSRLDQATAEQVDLWTDRILDARSLSELFAGAS